ncbi:MAG: 50S ribosomal protein L25 [Candidatus Peregrinibacteria bacterium]
MQTLDLEVTQGKYPDVRSARRADRVPMVYYGKGVKNTNFSADYQEFRRTYKKGGKSTIIKLVNENKQEFPVLIHEIQYHPVTDRILHVDVIAVDMNKPITTHIPLLFTGVSPAVKEEGGIFVKSRDSVAVKCLPKDLVYEIEVDISSLASFGNSLTVADIKVPAGIEILDAKDVNIAGVSAPRDIEAEEAAMAAADAAAAAAAEAAKAGEGKEEEEVKEEEGKEKAEGEEEAGEGEKEEGAKKEE